MTELLDEGRNRITKSRSEYSRNVVLNDRSYFCNIQHITDAIVVGEMKLTKYSKHNSLKSNLKVHAGSNEHLFW